MSELRVRAAIDQIEGWLADPAWMPDPEALKCWTTDFQVALAEVEKGPDWPAVASRAHAAGKLLEARLMVVAAARDQVKTQLEAQGRGNRALRGYGANRT